MVSSDANAARLPCRGEGFAARLPLVLLVSAPCLDGRSGFPHGYGGALMARQRDGVEDHQRDVIGVHDSATAARLKVEPRRHR